MPRNALAACAARAVLLLPLHSFALSSLKKSDPYTTKKLPVFFRFDPQILRKTRIFWVDQCICDRPDAVGVGESCRVVGCFICGLVCPSVRLRVAGDRR